MKNKLVRCSNCKGEGQTFEGYEDYYPLYESCGYCDSTGKTTRSMNAWISIWKINPSFEPSEKSIKKNDRILDYNKNGIIITRKEALKISRKTLKNAEKDRKIANKKAW